MAELAAVAAIIQIADVGARLSLKLFAFAETVASADKAIVFTSKDVSLTSSVLKEVGEVLRKDRTFRTYSPDAIKTATAIVTECSEVFQEIERLLVEKVPNISSNRRDRTSRATMALERFKWPYWQPKLQLLRSNLDRLRSTLLVMLNVITYQRLLSTEPVSVHASQTALIRDLIDSKERHIRKYEKLKRSITGAENATPRSLSRSDGSPAPSNSHAGSVTGEISLQVRQDHRATPSISHLNQEHEMNLKYLDHLMSLFDHLIKEVNTPQYQIGLLNRHRIRCHVHKARSSEVTRLYNLHGKAMIDQTLRIPVPSPDDLVTSANRQRGNIRERKRQREDRENSAHARKTKKDTGKRSQGPVSIRNALNQYWLDGKGIHPEVLQRDICCFLGPEARARPLLYNGVPGYELTSVRPFTPEQLKDLVSMSGAYTAESREMIRRSQEVYYAHTETGAGDHSHSESLPSQPANAAPPPQPRDSTRVGSAAYTSAYPSGSSFQLGPGYPTTSGYLTAGYLGSTRPGANYSNLDYGDEYNQSDASYMQAPINSIAEGYSNPSQKPWVSFRADPGDNRKDPRDPRLGPRDLRLDPRDLRPGSRDPKPDLHLDSRTIHGFGSKVSSPEYVSTQGSMDDSRTNGLTPSIPPRHSTLRSRSVTFSAVVPRRYDPRDSPAMRDGLRKEPVTDTNMTRRDLINQESWKLTRSSPKLDNEKGRSSFVAGDTHRRGTQGIRRNLVEMHAGFATTLDWSGRMVEPCVERPDVEPDEYSEWSGISSSDDNATESSPQRHPSRHRSHSPPPFGHGPGYPLSDDRTHSFPPPRTVHPPSHRDEPCTPAGVGYGRERDPYAAPASLGEAYESAYPSVEHGHLELESANESHAPSARATDEDLENDTQKTLEHLLALWTPLPKVCEGQ